MGYCVKNQFQEGVAQICVCVYKGGGATRNEGVYSLGRVRETGEPADIVHEDGRENSFFQLLKFQFSKSPKYTPTGAFFQYRSGNYIKSLEAAVWSRNSTKSPNTI